MRSHVPARPTTSPSGLETLGLAFTALALRRIAPPLATLVPPVRVVLGLRLARVHARQEAERRVRRRRVIGSVTLAAALAAAVAVAGLRAVDRAS